MNQMHCKYSLRPQQTITKSAKQLNQPLPSLTSIPTCTFFIPPQPTFTPKNDASQPLSIRVNIGNIPSQPQSQLVPSCPQGQQIKGVNLKRISDAVRQIKRGVLIYRYLEKDGLICKQILSSLFQQVQTTFLNALNCEPNRHIAEAMIQEQMNRKSMHLIVPCLQNASTTLSCSSRSISEHVNNSEIEDLRQQVETYRRDSIEASQKLDSIFKMIATIRERQESEKKARKELQQAVVAYVEDADELIQKISNKYKKEGKVTLIEQEVRQVLTKLKFKAFDTTAI